MSDLPIDSRRLYDELDPSFVRVHATYEDFFGQPPDQALITADVGRIGLETALAFIGRLSCHVDRVRGAFEGGADRRLLLELGIDPEAFARKVRPAVGDPPRTSLAPQHIAFALQRVMTACPTAGSSTEDADTSRRLLKFVIAAGEDGDPDVAVGGPDRLVSYLLRQYGLNSRRVSLYAITAQAELLTSGWVSHFGPAAAQEIDERLKRAGHIAAAEHLRCCFMLSAHFKVFAETDSPRPSVAIEPIDYLERSGIPAELAQRFVERYSATDEQLRSLYADEIEAYGPSAWRSATFDRKPLLRLSNGGVLPTSFQALERLGYEGTYWALRSQPEDDNDFTSRYGRVVEEFVKNAMTRVAALDNRRPALSGDFLYGRRKERALSSDVNLRYGPDWFAFEVVTDGRGSPRSLAATWTTSAKTLRAWSSRRPSSWPAASATPSSSETSSCQALTGAPSATGPSSSSATASRRCRRCAASCIKWCLRRSASTPGSRR